MGRHLIISEEQFKSHFSELAVIGVSIEGMEIVRHSSGSSERDKGDGFSSPSEYWKEHFRESISPDDFICTSCMKKRKKFVVGHVMDGKGREYLYPVCKRCNDTYKKWKSGHLFYAYSSRLKDAP